MFNRIAFAVRSDCVRRPIGLRSPSNRIASAVQSYNHRMYTLSTKSDSNTQKEGVSKLNQCGLKAQQPHSPGQSPGC